MRAEYSDPDDARRAHTLNAMLLASIAVALLTAVVVLPYPNGVPSALFLVLAAAVFGVLIMLTHRKRLNLASAGFALMLGVVTVGQPLLTGDLSTNVLIVPAGAVMLLYVFPLRHWYVAAAWVLVTLTLLQVGTNDADTVQLSRQAWIVNAALVTLLLVVVVLYAAQQLAAAVHKQDRLAHQLSARETVVRRLEEMANSDPLTGFLNRRSLEECLKAVPERSAVALLDLDHFKAINDSHSHAVGDALLVDFSGLLVSGALPDDMLFRLGGDEFLIVRPGSSAAGLGAWLHDVREQMQGRPWPELPPHATISFSAGVVQRGPAQPDVVLKQADQALYAAKEQGRNAIVIVD